MKTCCVVVIGHVDHGKTTLVNALTGQETDRLPEEKSRGLSITTGFAHRTYASGTVDFVDAPGHADFIQAMISGATGANAALVVISMVEGIGAQTLEHLRIAGLLGITNAVIAVNKADLLDVSQHEERLAGIRVALAQTSFSDAPLIVCSAVAAHGIEAIHAAVESLITLAPKPASALHSFLPIDRVFTMSGRGTIVTGTLQGAALEVGARATLQPSGREVTLRSLQSRGIDRQHIQVGERIAANLKGAAVTEITRGAVLCAHGTGSASAYIDAHLRMLSAFTNGLKHMEEVRVLFGTSSETAQVRLYGHRAIAQGETAYAQLRFKKPVASFAGQAAVLRRLSPAQTIGGAILLDPQSLPIRSKGIARVKVLKAAHNADVTGIAAGLCNAADGVAKLSDIARLSRQSVVQASNALDERFVHLGANVVSSTQDITAATARVLDALAEHHTKHPLRTMAPSTLIEAAVPSRPLRDYVEELLLADGQLRRADNQIALCSHDPMAQLSQDQRIAMDEIETDFRKVGLSAPSPQDLLNNSEDQDLAQLLIEKGRLVFMHNVSLRQTLMFHRDTVDAAAIHLAAAFPAPQAFTTSQARTALETSRRVIVPLLEHFDDVGLTIRDQNTRQINGSNLVSPGNAPC